MPFYFGDIHNHCGVSYGHGSLADAYKNARLQLDFASVTGHSAWPDMPKADARLKSVVDYHTTGFKKLEDHWEHYVHMTEENNKPGDFVTFFSYEWHSRKYGDYVAYFKNPVHSMLKPDTLKEFRQCLLDYQSQGIACMLVPHHIGYKTGYRGINWDSFSEDISPVVEIVSMHGCAECDDSPLPYLHTMGPLASMNTMQAGLAAGKHFGVTGSTDHHSAHPGSYGYGRLGLWAESLSRDSIWEAIQQRRTYALTGDKIELAFAVNEHPLGSLVPYTDERHISLQLRGGYALDKIEVIKNNGVIFHKCFPGKIPFYENVRGKLVIEVGWGEKGLAQPWDVELTVEDGVIAGVEPRFHGVDVVDPTDRHQRKYQFSRWERTSRNSVRFHTCTWGNPTSGTNANQALSLEIEGDPATRLVSKINNTTFSDTLEELHQGSKSAYIGGFLTGAVRFHRFMPEGEYCWETEFQDSSKNGAEDFYYLRVSQKNNQWAWSSPIRFSTLNRHCLR